MKDNRKTIQVLTILTIIFTIMGGSLAYWNWNTTEAQKTAVHFGGDDPEPWCSADGGGNITQSDVQIVPTTCTDSEYANANPGATPRVMKRKITVTANTNKAGSDINLSLWLKVNNLGSGLSQSNNFRYVLTTSSTSCEVGEIISEGNFKGITSGGQVNIISNRIYTSSTPQEYYLYIWLDKEETNTNTMNQPFNFTLGGECSNNTGNTGPEAPRLDDGMIPVTIDENGDVFTVSKTDTSWYSYENKEWANVVLVSDTNRQTYLNNLSNNVQVDEDDILAYYVWIPRYSYIINNKCSAIDDPTIETHIECYAPLTLVNDSVSNIVQWWYQYYVTDVNSSYTLDQATIDINNAMQTGTISTPGFENVSIMQGLALYNSSMSANASVTGTFNGNNEYSGPVSIDITFEPSSATVLSGDARTTYKTHPAFIWEGNTVAGIWVGKFETSVSDTNDCYAVEFDSNCTGQKSDLRILPEVFSLRGQTVKTQYNQARLFAATNNEYGLSGVDAHMMKNSEWGAVAYLSHSIYGINTEVTINDNDDYTTGRGYLDISYGEEGRTDYPQSTTGNITGVFDMSGGAWENVMGNYNGEVGSSGFGSLSQQKYFDLYPSTVFTGNHSTNTSLCTLETCGGHALYETDGWYGDYPNFVTLAEPWFIRGGDKSSGTDAGLFRYSSFAGGVSVARTFRSVLIPTS